jgi:hypothetical protein
MQLILESSFISVGEDVTNSHEILFIKEHFYSKIIGSDYKNRDYKIGS